MKGEGFRRRVVGLAEMRDVMCRKGRACQWEESKFRKASWSQVTERAGSQDLGFVFSLGP